MATTTTRLALRKPDPDPTTGDFVNVATDINASMDKLDASVGAVACTSAARPASPFNGQFARETDTNALILWNGASWLYVAVNGGRTHATICTSGARPSSPSQGLLAFETDTLRTIIWTGANWRTIYTEGSVADLVNAYGHSEGSAGALSSGTTTSSSYADIPGMTGLSFTKVAGTRLKVNMSVDMYSVSNPCSVTIAVRVSGTDYECGSYEWNGNQNEREPVTGQVYIPSLGAGTYAVQPRWKRRGGTGTVTVDVNDFYTFNILETK